MAGRRFHTVDVFAPERYAGNQLAVFHDAADLSTDEMLALTRETNYSEATFLVGDAPADDAPVDDAPADDRYPVRIFDPAEEIPFAGHPTIGTAAVLREFVRDDRPDELVLDLGVGDVPVTVEIDAAGVERYWMQQVEPTFGERVDRDAAAAALGLDVDDLLADVPIQVVSTGLPTLVVPLASLDAAERAATQPDAYEDLIVDDLGGCNLLVVTAETVDDGAEGDGAGSDAAGGDGAGSDAAGDDAAGGDGTRADLHVRVFADWADVPEDPATGSSNGCLAASLARHDALADRLGVDVPAPAAVSERTGTVDDADALVVEQGLEMGRPSCLHLRAAATDDGIDVRVGGRVVPVAEGHLL